jgi:hypothetical protein
VRPRGQDSNEYQYQDNQQDGANAHDLLPCFTWAGHQPWCARAWL